MDSVTGTGNVANCSNILQDIREPYLKNDLHIVSRCFVSIITSPPYYNFNTLCVILNFFFSGFFQTKKVLISPQQPELRVKMQCHCHLGSVL